MTIGCRLVAPGRRRRRRRRRPRRGHTTSERKTFAARIAAASG